VGDNVYKRIFCLKIGLVRIAFQFSASVSRPMIENCGLILVLFDSVLRALLNNVFIEHTEPEPSKQVLPELKHSLKILFFRCILLVQKSKVCVIQ